MAQILAFPAKKIPQPFRSLDRPSYPLSNEHSAMKMICEGIIFGCFLIGLVLMIFAMGGL